MTEQLSIPRRVEKETAALAARLMCKTALLSLSDIGAYIGLRGDSNVLRTIIKRDDFPRSVSLSERSPRWVCGEVHTYFENLRRKQFF